MFMQSKLVLILSLSSFCALSLMDTAHANPIGELEANGRFEIQSSNSDQFVRMNADQYTWFSGDTLRTHGEPAVLNLTGGGGGFGFTGNALVKVALNDQGKINVEISSGTLVYALPDPSAGLQIQAGNFTLSTSAPGIQPMNVSSADGFVGMVEYLAGDNIKVSIRSGEMYVQNGDAVRYQVSAGESVGLLDLPQQTIRTQSGLQPETLIDIESPQQVGTGDEFRVQWRSSEPVEGDYVVVAESGARPDEFDSIVSTTEGATLDFTAPGTPGSYEIRFIDAQTGAIKQSVLLDVIGDPAVGYGWWNRATGVLVTVAVGVVAVEIIDDIINDDDDPAPVSP